MKGLYIKDFKLLKNQKMFFIIIAIMAVFFAITQDNSYFIVSYTTFISSLFVISSISYDEFNNGNAFLFTLPVSREEYVKEKYLFAFSLSTVTCLLATILSNIVAFSKEGNYVLNENLLTSFIILLLALTLVMVIIPVQLKFGQNKGNIATVLVAGIAFIVCYLGVKISSYLNIDLSGIADIFNQIGIGGLMIIMVAAEMIVGFISYQISCKIMKSKEF